MATKLALPNIIGQGMWTDYYGRTGYDWYWVPQRSYVDFTLTAKVGFLTQAIKDYFLSLSADDFYRYF